MIILISPSKKLDENEKLPNFVSLNKADEDKKFLHVQEPYFENEASNIAKKLKKLSKEELKKILPISDNLIELNHNRYNNFGKFKKPALYFFSGEVFSGINANELKKSEVKKINETIYILSGLYGCLRPLDLISPYRLEMGSSFYINNKNDQVKLNNYWKPLVSTRIKEGLKNQKNKVIYNLASNEYSYVLDRKNIDAEIIDFAFLDKKNGSYKTIMVYAKNQRGKMAKYIALNNIKNAEELCEYDVDGYYFHDKVDNKLIFHRD